MEISLLSAESACIERAVGIRWIEKAIFAGTSFAQCYILGFRWYSTRLSGYKMILGRETKEVREEVHYKPIEVFLYTHHCVHIIHIYILLNVGKKIASSSPETGDIFQ